MEDAFIVTNRVDGARRKRTNTNVPKNYVSVQPVAGEWVVLGDIIARSRRVGPIIRYLYRQDYHFLTRAYNTFHLG